jgi:hypothetical protein
MQCVNVWCDVVLNRVDRLDVIVEKVVLSGSCSCRNFVHVRSIRMNFEPLSRVLRGIRS